MTLKYRINRMEFAGSLGDLGTLLPLAIGMVVVNGMSITGILFSIGLFYILAGLYFGVPVPVQPMKAIGAYAIATGVSPTQISGSAAVISLLLLFIGLTGAIDFIGKFIPKCVIRGVQLSTGVLLAVQGVRLISGSSTQQLSSKMVEPFLHIQRIGPVPVSIVLGVLGSVLILLLLHNRRLPAAIAVILLGIVSGLLLGNMDAVRQLRPGFHLPELLPVAMPTTADLPTILFVLVLPQLPMTIGNAIIANADLAKEYFKEHAGKVTYRTTTLSMAFANIISFILGGIPLCHGAGGLAAHYSFGARTGGSNLIIGAIFICLCLFFGPGALAIVHLLPLSILGVLLVFAGGQLALTILDMFNKEDMFVVITMLSVTLATNLAWGFLCGSLLAWFIKRTGARL